MILYCDILCNNCFLCHGFSDQCGSAKVQRQAHINIYLHKVYMSTWVQFLLLPGCWSVEYLFSDRDDDDQRGVLCFFLQLHCPPCTEWPSTGLLELSFNFSLPNNVFTDLRVQSGIVYALIYRLHVSQPTTGQESNLCVTHFTYESDWGTIRDRSIPCDPI